MWVLEIHLVYIHKTMMTTSYAHKPLETKALPVFIMATLHYYTPPPLLMKSLLYFSISNALFSCFVESREADTNSHFHTLQITSLLPDSVCSHSTEGSRKRQSTLEVIHRDSPCSHQTQNKPLTTPHLIDILSDDQLRVDSIQARLKPVSNTNKLTTNKFKDTKADLPTLPGSSFRTGNYIIRIGLGTPTKTLSLVFDTGSDLTWTQCQPCAKSCYQQQDPIFDPSSSSTYSNISCNDPRCSRIASGTGQNPGCYNNTCIYGIRYGDQSFSVGFFGKDKLSISPTDAFPDYLFGCGQQNQGLFGTTAGLIGLGRDNLSFVSQTATKYGKIFSYCLPSTSSSAGHLTFGKNRASPKNVKFTPFTESRGHSYYFIDIFAVFVGGTQLPVKKSVFDEGGTIIDSGTVITRFPPAAYGPMSAAFQQMMKMYPRAPAYSLLDTCYDFENYTTVTIPTISFVFGGGAKVDLDASGILIAVNSSVACLAFAVNHGAGSVGIFGNTQQKTFEVVYDVAGGNLGFGAGGCN